MLAGHGITAMSGLALHVFGRYFNLYSKNRNFP